MFWQYEEWTNAFIIQLVAILVAFLYGRKLKVHNEDLFIAISVISPVALFLVSAGAAGAIFLSDIAAIYLLIIKGKKYQKTTMILLAAVLFVGWPLISTMIANLYTTLFKGAPNFDLKWLGIQTVRYVLFFVLFSRLLMNTAITPAYRMKILKVQSIMVLFIFLSIILGFLDFIPVDPWNELIRFEQYISVGKGGMFLYRGGIGTLGALTIPIIYFCFIHGRGFYKVVMAFLVFIIFSAVVLSGSRQGVFFTFLTLMLSVVLLKQYKNALWLGFTGFVFVFLLLQNEVIMEASTWIMDRYELLLNKDVKFKSEIGDRNDAITAAEKSNKDLLLRFTGNGLGGKVIRTESDYYNTFSYFGLVGILVYVTFIICSAYIIFVRWRYCLDPLLKDIYTLSLICATVIPLFGLQQWYIMNSNSDNSMNAFLTLYILSFALAIKGSEPVAALLELEEIPSAL